MTGAASPADASGDARRRMAARELWLMQIESLPDLLIAATRGLVAEAGFACATLVVEDPGHELRHLLAQSGAAPLGPELVHTDSLIALAPALGRLSRPWSGAYAPADHALLFGAAQPRQVAILPLVRQGRLLALACLGWDEGPAPLDAEAQARLAALLGLCFENACNQARVARAGAGDFLTGWHGRRYLLSRLREELARAGRRGGSVACLVADIADLALVNERHGVAAGDAVLREVASRLEAQIRASDTAARVGGDEFALVLADADPELAGRVAARVIDAMEVPCEIPGGGALAVRVRLGAACASPARGDRDLKGAAERLLREADQDLYRRRG